MINSLKLPSETLSSIDGFDIDSRKRSLNRLSGPRQVSGMQVIHLCRIRNLRASNYPPLAAASREKASAPDGPACINGAPTRAMHNQCMNMQDPRGGGMRPLCIARTTPAPVNRFSPYSTTCNAAVQRGCVAAMQDRPTSPPLAGRIIAAYSCGAAYSLHKEGAIMQCAECNNPFDGRNGQKYCREPECVRVRRARAYRDWYANARASGMPARQTGIVPCAGCGKPCMGGKGSLPAGRRRCRECRRQKGA